MGISEGATGIFWFVYSSQQGWTGIKDALGIKTEISNLVNRTKPLKSTLLNAKKVSDKFTISGGLNQYISTLQSKDGTRYYAVLVNKGSCSASQNLTISSSLQR